ncbi:thiamine pyrophosphate-dependent enzyme [Microbacterium kribbense]|uniref:2-oxoisovalerate dehydrogenase subunit alpha n=1 Tax=Microbacterium kribbense TaxID=433645 RepID=A0ABP7G156_9MICO
MLKDLYTKMLITRQIDTSAIAMQREGVILAYSPLRGQEAAQIGSGVALDLARDFAFPTYRELGVAVAMGVDLVGYLASYVGIWHGGLYDPVASRFGSINAVVAGSVLHSVGWAKGAQLSGDGGVAVSYFGDGASSEGEVHEAMNLAGIDKLPVVFFCQNNGWAISLAAERQIAGGSVAARAAAYGIEGVQIDGNDVIAVLHATRQALARARAGEGPTVIEAMTYRAGPHSTSDDPGRYRSLDDEQTWLSKDPIASLADRLNAEGIADGQFFEAASAEAARAADAVRAGLVALTDRPGEELFDFVFANPTGALQEQKHAWQESMHD